jgi:elongator complex protein 1
MIAHEKALEWQELFNLAVLDKMDEEDIVAMGYRVAGTWMCDFFSWLIINNGSCIEDLSSKKRHAEAARVLLDYCKDLREAVIALVEGNGFSEARRIVCLSQSANFVDVT